MWHPVERSGQSWSGLVMVKKGDCKLEPVQRTRKVIKRMEIRKEIKGA